MKLLVVTQSGDIVGGANRSLLAVLEGLKNTFNHSIVCLVPKKGAFTEALDNMKIEYIVHTYFQTSYVRLNDIKDPLRSLRTTQRLIKNKLYLRGILRTLQKFQFDCVYINDTTNTIGYFIANALKIPFVWHFRGYDKHIIKYMFSERTLRSSPNGRFIAISSEMKKYMTDIRKLPNSKVDCIFNGVENKSTYVTQPWANGFNDKLHCVECGTISEAKGQIEAIEALGILKENGISNIVLHLAGTSSIEHGVLYTDVLKKRITELCIEDQVIFEGEIKHMSFLRKDMNVELMCSICEPFGRVTVEGMQAGLVVIGSNTGGTLDIIADHKNGLLYEQGCPESLAKCIAEIITDMNLANSLSRNALITVTNNFTMNKNIAEINEVFTAVQRENNCEQSFS